MDKFKCSICGKTHDIFKAIEAPVPEKVLEIPASEKAKRVKELGNSFIIDNSVFLLKGDIFIYLQNVQEPFFNWSVWVSLSLEAFKSKAKELEEGKNVGFDGQLESQLPFYETATKGLKAKAFVNINYDYAVIKIQEDSPLKTDQTEKITGERVKQLIQKMYHSD